MKLLQALTAGGLVAFLLLFGSGYIGRVDARNDRVHECIGIAHDRWDLYLKAHVDAVREDILTGLTHGLTRKVHADSAAQSAVTAMSLLFRTAPTEERREAYCRRLIPPTSFFG